MIPNRWQTPLLLLIISPKKTLFEQEKLCLKLTDLPQAEVKGTSLGLPCLEAGMWI